jgi:hypothetical protein
MSVSKQMIVRFAGAADAGGLGINAERVVAKRYSLKDLQGNPLEEWGDIVQAGSLARREGGDESAATGRVHATR